MCSKEDFTARITQGLADRKAEREAAEIEEAERRAYEHYMYVINKTDGHGKKRYGKPFFQT